jgi:hypothetical protein
MLMPMARSSRAMTGKDWLLRGVVLLFLPAQTLDSLTDTVVGPAWLYLAGWSLSVWA